MLRKAIFWLILFAASLGLGFVFTQSGLTTWDSLSHLHRSDWLVGSYGLPTHGGEKYIVDILKWYGPLWELWLGVSSNVIFGFLHDPTWVRHSMTFSLFPVTLALIATFIRKTGYSWSTSLLCSSLVFCCIRLGGHSLLNVTDAPLAMFYVISGFALWLGARKLLTRDAAGAKKVSPALLIGTTLLALAPYLIRPPVLLPLALWLGILALLPAPGGLARPWTTRLRRPGAALLIAMALCFLLWPSLWERGVFGWGRSFRQFTKFPWIGPVRVMGETFLSTQLPWSYALWWFPVVMTPVAFLFVLIGIAGHFRSRATSTRTGRLPLQFPWGLRVSLSFRGWMGIFAGLGWLAVLVMHPILYDEDRHLLFLFPPLMIWAGLGWEPFKPSVRWAATVVCIASGLTAYANWGVYSYVYKSRLVFDRSPDAYMGDYWGVCVPRILLKLPRHAPPGSELVVQGPAESALLQLERMGKAKDYDLRTAPSKTREYYAIQYNRMGALDPVRLDVKHGMAQLLESEPMPPGDDACWLVKYSAQAAKMPTPSQG